MTCDNIFFFVCVCLATEESKYGSYDNGDPTTTNLYLGNLNPKVS